MTTTDRITSFFEYWRQRATFIESLIPDGEHAHEAKVLVWATLDALANLWAKYEDRKPVGRDARRRMGDFLYEYGGVSFQRVSLPYLWHSSEQLKSSADTIGAIERLKSAGDRKPLTEPLTVLDRSSRSIDDDPLVPSLLANLADVAAVTVQAKPKKRSAEDWVLRARFGDIAYEQMRCAMLHEGRTGPLSHSFDLGASSQVGPTYLSPKLSPNPKIGFALAYMATVVRACIDGFERDALQAGRDPAPSRPTVV